MMCLVGRMVNAKPKLVEGEPPRSGVYIGFCFGDARRDVMQRWSVSDSHTMVQEVEGSRTMDNLYYFDADAEPGKIKWTSVHLGVCDGGVTHYLDFDVEYDISEEEAVIAIKKEMEAWDL